MIFEKAAPPRLQRSQPLDVVATPEDAAGRRARQPTSEQLARLSHSLRRTPLCALHHFVAQYSPAHLNAHDPRSWSTKAVPVTATLEYEERLADVAL